MTVNVTRAKRQRLRLELHAAVDYQVRRWRQVRAMTFGYDHNDPYAAPRDWPHLGPWHEGRTVVDVVDDIADWTPGVTHGTVSDTTPCLVTEDR